MEGITGYSMKRLLSYLGKYKILAVLAPAFKMLEAVFELIIPLIVAEMIDKGIPSEDGGVIIRLGIIMVILGIVGFICAVTAQYFSAKAAVCTARDMRLDLFRHIQSLSHREIDSTGTATLITRATNDITKVQNGINMFLRLFLRSPFIVAGAVIMAFTVDSSTARIFLIVVPLLFAVTFFILLKTMPMHRQVQDKTDDLLLQTRENLSGVRVVRAFNREDEEYQTFRENASALSREQLKTGFISSLLNPLTLVIVDLGIVFILKAGGARVDTGLLSRGQVVALVNYMSQILVELIKFSNLVILLSRAMASLKRICSVFDIRSSIKDPGNVPAGNSIPGHSDGLPVLSFRNVSFAYAGSGKEVLSDISFSAMPGGTLGVIGGTGSGKTTLISLIPRFYDVSEGSVSVYGTDVRDIPLRQLRELVAVVPQKSALISGTVRSNMQWGDPKADRKSVV